MPKSKETQTSKGMTPSYHNTSRDNGELIKPLKRLEPPTKSQITDKQKIFSGKINGYYFMG